MRSTVRRCRRWRLVAAWSVLLLWPNAAESDPLPGYRHTTWTADDGAPTGIRALAQDRDGFLWIAAAEGLFRFDGLSFERIPPARSQADKASQPVSLAVGRAGELWVGYDQGGGVAVLRDGRLSDTGLPDTPPAITALIDDAEGATWAFWGGFGERAWRRHKGHWSPVGTPLKLPFGNLTMPTLTRTGALIVGVLDPATRTNRIAVLPKKGSRFLDFQVDGAVPTFAADRQGRLWMSDRIGTRRIQVSPDGHISQDPLNHPAVPDLRLPRIAFDHDGGIWGITRSVGLFRIPAPEHASTVQAYREEDGLTSDFADAVLVDEEGDVWVGTEQGLDKFRKAAVVPYALRAPEAPRAPLVAARATDGSLYVLEGTSVHRIGPDGSSSVLKVPITELQSICPGRGGSVWLAYTDRLVRLGGGIGVEIVRVPGPPNAIIACAEDAHGRIWLSGLDTLRWHERGRWRALALSRWGAGAAHEIAVTTQDEVLVSLEGQHLAWIVGDRLRVLSARRMGIGYINGIDPGLAYATVSGSAGLARVGQGQVQTIGLDRLPWAARTRSAVETSTGDTWFLTPLGLRQVRTADLDRAFRSATYVPPSVLYDREDGLVGSIQHFGVRGPQLADAGRGRVWVLTKTGLMQADARRRPTSSLAPTVLITDVRARGLERGVTANRIDLPVGVRNLSVSYTATSLSVPRRNRFRYRLEGVDGAWVDPGLRRQAFYTNLPPGTFRFRVQAASGNGIWNQRGDVVDIVVPPVFSETATFRFLCVLAALMILAGLYSLRLRSVAARVRASVEERTAERERIARELHDTLLQTFQGTLVWLQALSGRQDVGADAKRRIERGVASAQQALIEGRDRVAGLREREAGDLVVLLRHLASEQAGSAEISVRVVVDGRVRDLAPHVSGEALAIAREAVANASQHAQATVVSIRVEFRRSGLVMSVDDDGRGIDPAILTAGREGHFGLTGMRERARRLGGELDIRSASVGTSVILGVPAARAYDRKGAWWSWPGSRPVAAG